MELQAIFHHTNIAILGHTRWRIKYNKVHSSHSMQFVTVATTYGFCNKNLLEVELTNPKCIRLVTVSPWRRSEVAERKWLIGLSALERSKKFVIIRYLKCVGYSLTQHCKQVRLNINSLSICSKKRPVSSKVIYL